MAVIVLYARKNNAATVRWSYTIFKSSYGETEEYRRELQEIERTAVVKIVLEKWKYHITHMVVLAHQVASRIITC